MHETPIMLHMVFIIKSIMLSGISLIFLVVTSFFSFQIDTEAATQVIPKYLSLVTNQSPYFCSVPQNGLPLLPLYE